MKKAFTLKKARTLPKAKFSTIRAEKLKDQADIPPFFVRGIKAGSKEEYWVSLALEKIEALTGWGWDYQVPVYGGRKYAGGNVIDFLLYTPGRYTMIQPEGRYWHTGVHEDMDEMSNVARRKKWNLIVWFTDETPTKESVYTYLKNKLNV